MVHNSRNQLAQFIHCELRVRKNGRKACNGWFRPGGSYREGFVSVEGQKGNGVMVKSIAQSGYD